MIHYTVIHLKIIKIFRRSVKCIRSWTDKLYEEVNFILHFNDCVLTAVTLKRCLVRILYKIHDFVGNLP